MTERKIHRPDGIWTYQVIPNAYPNLVSVKIRDPNRHGKIVPLSELLSQEDYQKHLNWDGNANYQERDFHGSYSILPSHIVAYLDRQPLWDPKPIKKGRIR